jgi:hypothetical protein
MRLNNPPLLYTEQIRRTIDNINELKLNTMDDLIEKYGISIIMFAIKVDKLSPSEIADFDYLEDRILTHLEEYENQ